MWSASQPAHGVAKKTGRSCARTSRPIEIAVPVASRTSAPTATNRNQSPPSEITEARNSRRKSRLRPSRSTASRRPARRSPGRHRGARLAAGSVSDRGGSRPCSSTSPGSVSPRSAGTTASARSTSTPGACPPDAPPADVILITHAHYDHFQPDEIARLATDATQLVAPHDVAADLSGRRHARRAGGVARGRGPAVHDRPGLQHAPGAPPEAPDARSAGSATSSRFAGTTYYHAGDTDHAPELG